MKRIALAMLGAVAVLPVIVVACKTQATEVASAGSASASASASVAASASAAAAASASVAVSSASASASVSASGKPDCAKMFAAMQVGPNAVKRKYAACASDSDCALVSGRACLASCNDAINIAGVAEHERALKAIEPACTAFINGPCMYSYPIAVPTCPVQIPRCRDGKCVAVMR